METLKKYGVNLIATKESLSSEELTGDLVIKILSIVAEMERENIIEQTKNGKKYNALQGGWNGGQAPYGYKLDNKRLVVVPEEKKVVEYIYDLFLSDDKIGYTGIVCRLNEEGIEPRKVPKKSLKDKSIIPPQEHWDNSAVKRILDNPVYIGKLVYGKDTIVKQEDGTKKRVHNAVYTLVDGLHEPIIEEQKWNMVQEKRKRMANKHKRDKSKKSEVKNLLSQLIICPECGNRMIATKTGGHRNKHGEMKYYHSYVCGYNNNHKGCCHKNAVKTERIDIPVIETLRAYIQKKEFMLAVKEQLEKQVDISSIEKEIAGCKKEQEKLQARESQQYSILEKIGYDEKYKNVKEDRILDAINRIAEESSAVQEKLLAKEKALTAAKNNSLTMEKIQYAIENFAVVFQSASKDLQNELIQHFVDEIRLERDSENGKLYPKSMVIKFTGEEIDLVVENLGVKKSHVETVCLLSRKAQ